MGEISLSTIVIHIPRLSLTFLTRIIRHRDPSSWRERSVPRLDEADTGNVVMTAIRR
jgi:hypothetical protein